MNEISFSIPGVPIAKARPRFARRGKFVTTYNIQESQEGKFRWELLRCVLPYRSGDGPLVPSGVPIGLSVIFYMPIPSGLSQKKLLALGFRHIKKPDADNLLKFLKDCGNGVLWADDSQVWEVRARKIYDPEPRTDITLQWEADNAR
jgi:Holliday junction resolvase RusA-like endonuclease